MAKASAKKKWFTLVAPKLFREKEIGETTAYEAKTLVGKTLKTNLSSILEDIKKQNSEIQLVVDDVKGEKAMTSFIGYKLLAASLKRHVRKGRSRIDETIKAVTKDDKVVTIKVIVVTHNVIQGGVKTALHNSVRELWLKKISNSTFDQLAEQVVSGRLYKEMKDALKHLYPLRACEVLAFKLERFAKAVDVKKAKQNVKNIPEKPASEEEDIEEDAQAADEETVESSEENAGDESKESAEQKDDSEEKKE